MNKFSYYEPKANNKVLAKQGSYKTTKKYTAPSLILGVILLLGLLSPALVGASIIVTGTTTTTHPLCHDPSCTTTTTQAPITTTTTTHPVCHSPSVSIFVAPPSIPYNGSAVLHWTSYNTNYCTASASPYNYQWSGNVSLNGDRSINNLTKTTTFTITCNSNCHNPVSDSTIVYVQAPITRYACNTSTWQCVVNSSGPYTSLSTCQANCQAPVPTRYSCNTNTYQCYATTNGEYTSLSTCDANCNAPCPRYTCNSNYQCVVDSNGSYTSLSTCQNNCIAPTRYACNTNTYQCYQTTSGDYSNFNDCATNCQPPVTRYTCNSNYQCVTATNGEFTSLGSCQNNCIAPTRYACNTSTWQCYQTTSGPYASYNDCANACQQIIQSLSISCYASPNPTQVNQTVTFSSNVSGGSGSYTYYWSGATYGNNSYSQKSFSSYGNYIAYLTVHDSQNRSASTSCSVNVNEQQCTNTPSLSLWADKYSISQEESTYLRWTSTNSSYCTASNGWSGNKPTSGYESVSPNSDTTYSLTCYGSCGQITRSIAIYATSVSTNLNLTKLGRNLSAGERVYSKVIRVTEGDVIEFHLTITAGNNKDLYNANVKDIMPSVLSYMPSTTKIDNIVQPDTITITGLSLGTIYKGASKTIVFQAISAFPGTYLTYTNTAEVTADNESKITDSASITYGLVAGAATIRTGPLNTLLISFIISLALSLMIWYYLKFNPKGQLVFIRSENKIRDIWLAYTRRRIMRKN